MPLTKASKNMKNFRFTLVLVLSIFFWICAIKVVQQQWRALNTYLLIGSKSRYKMIL